MKKQASCHPNRILYCKEVCRPCYERRLLIRNPDYKQKKYEYHKQWSKQNKPKVDNYTLKRRTIPDLIERDRKNKWVSYLKRQYGLTENGYSDLLEKQNNKCAICKVPFKKRSIHIDHHHSTGKLRDILCNACNRGLGMFKDSISILQEAINYIT